MPEVRTINDDPEFRSLASRLIEAKTAELRSSLSRRIVDLKLNKGAPSNAIAASALSLTILNTALHDVMAHGEAVWASMLRIHETTGGSVYDDLAAHLKNFFVESFRLSVDRLLTGVSKALPDNRKPGNDAFDREADRVARRMQTEIDIYIVGLRRARPAGETAMAQTFHFYSSVGAVQTGPNAIANIQQLTDDRRGELIAALEALRDAISAAPNVKDREDLVEIADDAKQAVAQKRPNMTKLGGLLLALSEGVQGVASVEGAWKAVKDLFGLIGVTLS